MKPTIGQAVHRVIGAADAEAHERRETPPRAEVEIGIEHGDPGGVIAVVKIVAAAEWAELGIAAKRLEDDVAAELAGEVEPQPVVPGIADTEGDEHRTLDVLL